MTNPFRHHVDGLIIDIPDGFTRWETSAEFAARIRAEVMELFPIRRTKGRDMDDRELAAYVADESNHF